LSLYIRSDYHCCPNPLSLDSYSACELNCLFCFCKQLEGGWLKNVKGELKPYTTDRLEKQLRQAFRSNRDTKNPVILALRAGMPVILGRKSEPFCPAEREHHATEHMLKVLDDYGVNTVVETRMVEGVLGTVLRTNTEGVNISMLFGDEKVRNLMEPETPPYEERWALARELKGAGLHVGMIAEPLIPTINDREEFYLDYARRAAEAGVDHVNFGELRVQNVRVAAEMFAEAGADLVEIVERASKVWISEGLKIFRAFEAQGVPVSTPDWVNFGTRNSCEGCCGLDPFGVHHFTFQRALRVLEERGEVTFGDMADFNIFGERYAERFREIWNGKPGYYHLDDAPGVVVVGKDGDGNIVYGRTKTLREVFR